MGFFRRLRLEISSFFETDESEEEEINLRTFSIIFLLGLVILFGSYFIFFEGYKPIYSNIAYSFRSSAMSDPNIIGSYEIISCKSCKISLDFKKWQGKETLLVDYELSHRSSAWRQIHKIFERIFKIPIDFGWVQINKKIDNEDWSHYTAINLLAKGTGEPSNLEFSIAEEDGDTWYFFDKTSLASKGWIEIKLPFENFINPGWASHGDGKREFNGVVEVKLTITNFERAVNNALYFAIENNEFFILSKN